MTTLISNVLTSVNIEGTLYRVDIQRVSQMYCFKVQNGNGVTTIYRITVFDEGEQRIIRSEPCELVNIWQHAAMACIAKQPIKLIQFSFDWNSQIYTSDVRRQVYQLEDTGAVVSAFWQPDGMRFVAKNIRQLNRPEDLLPIIPTAQQ